MKKLLAFLIISLFRIALWFRYRVTIKGEEHLNPTILNKPGGILFLPNHPTVFVDPTVVTLAIWSKYPIRPMIVEYMYYTTGIHWLMRQMNALPVPDFVLASNSLKKRKADQVIDQVIQGLNQKENFLVYPAGKTKHQAHEVVGGSAIHKIIQSAPTTNVVLVRTTGLWGSTFSRALNGRTPNLFQGLLWGVKTVFKNLIFFTPRREITIEFAPAPADFPWNGTRFELNRYLEKWYNRPDGLSKQEGEEPGESLVLVSYSAWKEDLPDVSITTKNESQIDLGHISKEIQEKVIAKLAELTHLPTASITPDLDLTSDLGLDSLDGAEIIAFLDDAFDVGGVPLQELTTVGKVMALAGRQVTFEPVAPAPEPDRAMWDQARLHQLTALLHGATIPEVFLKNCDRMGNEVACADTITGVLTYRQLKFRALLLAEYIKNLPGDTVGILLPSSSTAYITILACQLAGKVPLLVNWTVGNRHLEAVVSLSGIKTVISSWSFIDRLQNVDLNGIEDQIIMLEEMRRSLTLTQKAKAFYLSRCSTSTILKHFDYQQNGDSRAVLLFTSGTESLPKGVPLTHRQILSNQRAALKEVGIFEDDIILGMLPPFHAFGFTVTGLLPLLAGIRAFYSPDPTDGATLARAVRSWKVSLLCGTPSFLKGIFKNGEAADFKTLRLAITGAEKAPADLFELVRKLGDCHLIEGYGITECAPVLTVNLTGNPAHGVGKPLEGVTILIVSLDQHQPLPQGMQGLILAYGPNVFNGYLNKNIDSPFVQINGTDWYVTGDLGFLDPEGHLILSGRLKRFIKIGGEMISLSAIEETLQKELSSKETSDDQSHTVAVCAKEEAGERPRIVVFTTTHLSLDDAQSALKKAGFSNLVKLSEVRHIPEIPLMGSGKTHYRSLEQLINT